MLFAPTNTQDFIKPVIAIVIVQKQEPPKPVDQTYVTIEGDSLDNIATAYGETTQRLFDKNTDIVDPNVISVGQTIVIPLKDEVLAGRIYPVSISVVTDRTALTQGSSSLGGFSSSGNTYYAGQCTAFVKDQLSWVQNGWGNASDWAYNAQRSGFSVSDAPRVGSIAWAKGYSHVAIVRSIGVGTVTVEEQNYKGPFIVSTRVAPVGEFRYISP